MLLEVVVELIVDMGVELIVELIVDMGVELIVEMAVMILGCQS
jgi:hypothetical protein